MQHAKYAQTRAQQNVAAFHPTPDLGGKFPMHQIITPKEG